VRKKRYIEELESRVRDLELRNAKLKERLERQEGTRVFERSQEQKVFEQFADKGEKTQEKIEEIGEQKGSDTLTVKELRQKHDIWNSGRMRIVDQAKKFTIQNILPDYLKYEFSLCHYQPEALPYSEVEKIQKMTKYQVTERREKGQWTILDDYVRNVGFTETQWRAYQASMPKLLAIREQYGETVKAMIDTRNRLHQCEKAVMERQSSQDLQMTHAQLKGILDSVQ
jgi:flagellar biosynthesis chaperone FliJ